jgi:outer membrane murein-binding lipoprotein Lpp
VLDWATVNAFIAAVLDSGAEPATARSRQLAVRRFSAWCAEEGETRCGVGSRLGRGGAVLRPPYGPVAAAGIVPTVAAPDPTAVARKLRQHDNEFEAVYDLLRVVDGKIDAVEARVTTLDGKVTTLAAKVTTLDGKVTTLDGKVTTLAAKVTTLDEEVTTLAAKVTTLDGKVTAGFERLENTQQQILDLLQRRQDTTTE